MEKEKLSGELLQRYLDGNCSQEEKLMVDRWFNEQINAGNYNVDHSRMQIVEEQIWSSITEKRPARIVVLRRSKATLRFLYVAAASVLIAILFTVFYQTREKQPFVTQVVEYTAPANVNKLIQLPDGSTVILDKGSKIAVLNSFLGSKTREVTLQGKAYFDIKHLVKQPFIVHSGSVKTTVLGTAFDIDARQGNGQISVQVIRGKVNVSTDQENLGDLVPNRKLTYDARLKKSVLTIVNAHQEMKWTSNDIQMNDITFEAICGELQKRFGTKLEIADDELRDKKFTISLLADDSLEVFLNTICDFNGATYQYDKKQNKYIIRSKK